MKQLFSFLYFFIFLIFGLHSSKAQIVIDSTQFYFDLAINANQKKDSKKSFDYFEEKLKDYRKRKDVIGEIYALTLIAQIQRNLGLINESEGTAIEAIKLLDQLSYNTNQNTYRVSLYNHLGILYRDNGNFQTSIDYYEKILKLIEDPKKKIIVLNNLGNVYREKGDLESAIKLYEASYAISLNFDNKKVTARVLNNLGKAQSIINDSNAINNLEKALRLREEISYKNGVISSFLSLGGYYKKEKNTSKALSYSEEALTISNSFNKIEQKLAAIELQFDLGYFNNYSEYKIINDSLLNSRRLSKNNYAAIKYEKEKEISRANKSDLEKEKEKSTRILFQSLSLLVLVSSVLLYFLLKSRHKKDKLLQVYNTETRISKKVHDEVANDVYHVMTKLQSAPNSNETVLDDLENIYNRTRDISKENSAIDVNENFDELLSDLLISYKNKNIDVMTRNLSKIDWNTFHENKKTTLYRVLQELMTNMRKYSKASIVAIAFNKEKGKLIINYNDNGIGCDLVKNNGLTNAENRIQSINGTITFESEIDKGFKAKIII